MMRRPEMPPEGRPLSISRTEATLVFLVTRESRSSASTVEVPTMPSGGRPLFRWNCSTATAVA
jgi:hypothetical protein